jgi:Protein of unknown function (DUF3047)
LNIVMTLDLPLPAAFRALAVTCLFASLLSGCAGLSPEAPEPLASAGGDLLWASAAPGSGGSATWKHRAFPGKSQTSYQLALYEGRQCVRSDSSSAASMLRQTLHVEPNELGKVSFSWKVPALIASADLTQAETSDSPVRVVLAFDGDRTRFSAKNAMVSELALALTGEPLPYATLMYVWGTQLEPGSVVRSQRTDRIRKLVLESGPEHLGRWLDYERDIKADFEKAFGEAPGALIGVGIMTDTDNTRGQAQAWYGPVSLKPAVTTLSSGFATPVSSAPDAAPLKR